MVRNEEAFIRKEIVARLMEVSQEVNYPCNSDIVNGIYIRQTSGQPFPAKGKIGELLWDSKNRSVLICCVRNGNFIWQQLV